VRCVGGALEASPRGAVWQPLRLLVADLGQGLGLALRRELARAPGGGLKVRPPPMLCMTAFIEPDAISRLMASGRRDVLTKDSDVRAFALRVMPSAAAMR
jgi:CheY-like chemotaxis protein